jgi:hypothetical protein
MRDRCDMMSRMKLRHENVYDAHAAVVFAMLAGER